MEMRKFFRGINLSQSEQLIKGISIFIISFFLTLPLINGSLLINQWSLSYLRLVKTSNYTIEQLVGFLHTLPSAHWRGRLWIVENTIELEEFSLAQMWLIPLSDSNAFWTHSLFGTLYDLQDKTAAAAASWIRAGDEKALYAAGNRALQKGQLDTALYYREALYHLDPEVGAEPYANILWRARQDADSAIEVLQSALEEYPNSTHRLDWLRRLGHFLYIKEEWNKAIGVYEQVLELDPRNPVTYVSLGLLYYDWRGDLDKAYDLIQYAIDLAPEKGGAYHAMGIILSKEEYYEQSDIWFVKALNREPENHWWYYDRAKVARESGDLELAIQVYEEVVKLFPTFHNAYSELAWSYYLSGRYTDALLAIQRAITLTENLNTNYWIRAGMIYEKLGQYSNAFAAYKKAIQLTPDDLDAKAGVDRLFEFSD